ncbi:MAG: hypothetical protein H8E37_11055 [Planctomycetes bacterium]|nr:hypothetical protein [Planctomycetota bacterium]
MGIRSKQDAVDFGCVTIGIAVPLVFRDETAEPTKHFPLLLKTFQRRFSLALLRAVFEFVKDRTTPRPPHFHVLGRRAVWQVGKQLAAVRTSFPHQEQTLSGGSNCLNPKLFRASHLSESQPDVRAMRFAARETRGFNTTRAL